MLQTEGRKADLIVINGRIATQDKRDSIASAVAIREGRIMAVGSDSEILQYKSGDAKIVDLKGRTVIPGLNDSHTHVIRSGLSYNSELRWEGLTSLREGLRMIREQASRTPSPYWVKVVGGWSEFQFKERRMPTLEEINDASPTTPVFVLHLYRAALLNKQAIAAANYTKETPDPVAGEIQRDKEGNPTGMLVARPNATILYSTLAKSPKLSYEGQMNSTRRFMTELNGLGITSIIDAGGGFQNYPDDYAVIMELSRQNLLTVRMAYNLFTQRPNHELEDFTNWTRTVAPGSGNDFYRLNGAGEMLVYSGADYEDFPEPRPELPEAMEGELTQVVSLLVQKRWPFRLHATYNESIERFLDVFEAVDEKTPFEGLKWCFDHAETISSRNIERVRRLRGGIAIQDRLAFQGEYFIERYGEGAARNSPPIVEMIRAGVPVGAGTDATRVASYNPWIALYWLVSGRTVGRTELHPPTNRLSRKEALRLWTMGSAWFSGEQEKKGSIEVGKLADMVVLSRDYFTVPEEEIPEIGSVLTMVGGRVVFASGDFAALAPPELPAILPEWSPVSSYGGYQRTTG